MKLNHKKPLLLFCLLVIGISNAYARFVSPTHFPDSIKKAMKLVNEKKYKTAFVVLQNADPDNLDTDIILQKENIVLNYFIESIDHEMFSLMDLKANESVEDYRGKEGTSDLFNFEIDKSLNKLIKLYPKCYKLYEGLAEFYESAYDHYGGNWLINEDSLTTLIRNNYQLAIDHNVAKAHGYFRVGVFILQDKEYRKAIKYLLKSYQMDSTAIDCTYNLAYAYLFCDSRDTALHYAKLSEAAYRDSSMKGDAERMLGEIYIEKKDTANSIKYYELANTTDPQNYNTMKSLLRVYVESGNTKRKKFTDDFFMLDPENPTIYNDLIDIYSDSSGGLQLINFFKSKLPAYSDNSKVTGNLYFYLANLELSYDKKAANDYAIKAKDVFSKLFGKDHPVFTQIDKLIEIANEPEDKGKN